MSVNTIVFGPTGGVGSAAATFAQSRGAKVYLAMRDTTKPVPGLSESDEEAGNYVRIQADLTKPDTVLAAAKESKAQSAFFYLMFGQHEALAQSIKAMKAGGIKRLVFLSSWSVEGDIRKVAPQEFIPYAHAQIEIVLEEVYGEGNFTALRPAWFASNLMWYADALKRGEKIKEVYADYMLDFIPPEDTGSVAGALLAKESGPVPRIVAIAGQQLVPFEQMIKDVGKANGKDIEVESVSEEEGLKIIMARGLPEPIARYLIVSQKDKRSDGSAKYGGPVFEEAQKAVKKWTGRDPITLPQWIQQNKGLFA